VAKKTWIWIIVGIGGFGLLMMLAVAGAGVYFVPRHIETQRTSGADALRAFDDARARFKDQPPIVEVQSYGRKHRTRDLSKVPSSSQRPEHLWILAWDPDEGRIVKISLPFWLLEMGRRRIDVNTDGFDFNELDLDVKELRRIGPALVLDFRETSGERVLIWTQ
jgi:hypothetical protein